MIDKSAIIVAIYTFERKGNPSGDLLQGLKRPLLGPIFKGSGLGPLGTKIDHHQRPGVISFGQASIVTYEIHLYETRLTFFPVGMSADRDVFFEEGSGLGPGFGFKGQAFPFRGQQAVYGSF